MRLRKKQIISPAGLYKFLWRLVNFIGFINVIDFFIYSHIPQWIVILNAGAFILFFILLLKVQKKYGFVSYKSAGLTRRRYPDLRLYQQLGIYGWWIDRFFRNHPRYNETKNTIASAKADASVGVSSGRLNFVKIFSVIVYVGLALFMVALLLK